MGFQEIRTKIAARIRGRLSAHDILDLLDYPTEYKHEWAESLLKGLREELLPPDPTEEPELPELPYRKLAETVIPFGKFGGLPLENVDPDYLDWFCREHEHTDKFYQKVKAFLKHEERPD